MPTIIKLDIKYFQLSQVELWDRNPKKHDYGALIHSFQKYGFQSPPKLDETLGGIIAGNGRIQALRKMKESGLAPPTAILVDDFGEWLVPLVIGNDIKSKGLAEAYAIDNNNLTVMGGDGFTALDMASLWEMDKYVDVVEELMVGGETIVSIDGDDMDLLLSVRDGFYHDDLTIPDRDEEDYAEFDNDNTESEFDSEDGSDNIVKVVVRIKRPVIAQKIMLYLDNLRSQGVTWQRKV